MTDKGRSKCSQRSRGHKTFQADRARTAPAWGLDRSAEAGSDWSPVSVKQARWNKAEPSPHQHMGREGTYPPSTEADSVVSFIWDGRTSKPNTRVKSFFNLLLLLFKQTCCHQRMTQRSVTVGPVYIITTIIRTAKENFEALPLASINSISSFSSHKFPSNILALHINTLIRFCTSTCRIVRAEKLCFQVDSEGKSICFKKKTLSGQQRLPTHLWHASEATELLVKEEDTAFNFIIGIFHVGKQGVILSLQLSEKANVNTQHNALNNTERSPSSQRGRHWTKGQNVQ